MPDIVRLSVNRSSVAMGDDVDDHQEFWTYPSDATIDDLLIDIATGYVPAIGGAAGWCVYRGLDDPRQRSPLGLIYSRHGFAEEPLICRVATSNRSLGKLAGPVGLDIYAEYLTHERARPLRLTEVQSEQGRERRGSLTRALAVDRAHEAQRWRMTRDLRTREAPVAQMRRSWVSQNLLTPGTRLPGVEAFTANGFHHLGALLCPASLALTTELLGLEIEKPTYAVTGADIAAATGDSAVATLAMVIGAFEWGVAQKTWENGPVASSVIYLDQLESWGYSLSTVEAVIGGRRPPEGV